MKKIKILLVLLVASLSGFAQTALCLENNSDCEVHFAIYGEALTAPCALTGCNGYRIDVKVPPSTVLCYGNHLDIGLITASVSGWSGTIDPSCSFRYTRVEMQQLSPCSGCGVTVGINACGLPLTDTNCGRTLTWTTTGTGITLTWP